MKTVSYTELLNGAAEKAGRTRDKIPTSEATLIKGFLADALEEIWTSQCWPELVPALEQFTPDDNRQVSKREDNEQDLQELGDVLGVYTLNPRATTRARPIAFDEGDNVVRLHEAIGSVWIEYMLPCPDLEEQSEEDLATLEIPRRFKRYLTHMAASHLLRADGMENSANGHLAIADNALQRQISRLPPPPPYRSGVRVRDGGRVRVAQAVT